MAFGQAWADAKAERDQPSLPTIQDAFDHYVDTGAIRRPLRTEWAPSTTIADGERP